MPKASFILYNDYVEQVDMLDDAQAGQLFRCILQYSNTGSTQQITDAMVSVVFSFIRRQLDKDSKKYEETCQKRSEAGKKGGRPRKNTEELVGTGDLDCPQDNEKPNAFLKKQTKAKKADNEYENDNENDSEYENELISGDGGEEEGDTRPCAEEVIHIFDGQYRTIRAEKNKFDRLTEELFAHYAHKQPTEYDMLPVFENTHGIGVLDDDSHYAVYDSDKAELLRYAFNLAANADNVNWGYINGIYANFRRRDIRCVDDAYRYDWERNYGSITT